MANAKGIFKRPRSPYWWIRWTGPDGRQRKESTKTILKTEAEYILACRRKAAMEGVLPPTPKMQREKKKEEESARKTFLDLKRNTLRLPVRRRT